MTVTSDNEPEPTKPDDVSQFDLLRLAIWAGFGAGLGFLFYHTLARAIDEGKIHELIATIVFGGVFAHFIEPHIEKRISPSIPAEKHKIRQGIGGWIAGFFLAVMLEAIQIPFSSDWALVVMTFVIGTSSAGTVTYVWGLSARSRSTNIVRSSCMTAALMILVVGILTLWGVTFRTVGVYDQIWTELPVRVVATEIARHLLPGISMWSMFAVVGALAIVMAWRYVGVSIVVAAVLLSIVRTYSELSMRDWMVLTTQEEAGILFLTVGWGLGMYFCPGRERLLRFPSVSKDSKNRSIRWGFVLMLILILGAAVAPRLHYPVGLPVRAAALPGPIVTELPPGSCRETLPRQFFRISIGAQDTFCQHKATTFGTFSGNILIRTAISELFPDDQAFPPEPFNQKHTDQKLSENQKAAQPQKFVQQRPREVYELWLRDAFDNAYVLQLEKTRYQIYRYDRAKKIATVAYRGRRPSTPLATVTGLTVEIRGRMIRYWLGNWFLGYLNAATDQFSVGFALRGLDIEIEIRDLVVHEFSDTTKLMQDMKRLLEKLRITGGA